MFSIADEYSRRFYFGETERRLMTGKKTTLFYGSFIILECALWGIGNPVAKIGIESMPPYYFLAIRFTLACLLFVAVNPRAVRRQLNRRSLLNCLKVGPFTAGAFIFSVVCLQFTAVTTAGFFFSLSILFTPGLNYLLFHRKPDRRLLLITIIVIAGLYLLCVNQGSFRFGLGELLALMSACSFAISISLSEKYVGDAGVLLLSATQSGVAAIISFALALMFEQFQALSAASLDGWLSVLYLVVCCTFIAYLLQNAALKRLSAVVVSLAMCSEPIFTAVASYFILGETLSPRGLTGAALVMVGLVLAAFMQQTAEPAAADTY